MFILPPLVPGPLLLTTTSEMARFGGLSGLSTAAVAFLCPRRMHEYDGNRIIWATLLGLTGIKIAVELSTATSIFLSASDTAIRPLPLVHIMGCAAAIVAWKAYKPIPIDNDDVPPHWMA